MEQETAAVGTADAGRPVWRWLIYAGLAIAGILLLLSVAPMMVGSLSELFIPALLLFVCFKLAEIAALLRKR